MPSMNSKPYAGFWRSLLLPTQSDFKECCNTRLHRGKLAWWWQWGLCALRHGIQISMEAILACHPARSTEWLDCHPKSCELWRIRTGPIDRKRSLKGMQCHDQKKKLSMTKAHGPIAPNHLAWTNLCQQHSLAIHYHIILMKISATSSQHNAMQTIDETQNMQAWYEQGPGGNAHLLVVRVRPSFLCHIFRGFLHSVWATCASKLSLGHSLSKMARRRREDKRVKRHSPWWSGAADSSLTHGRPFFYNSQFWSVFLKISERSSSSFFFFLRENIKRGRLWNLCELCSPT